jgi:hypothetical protein
VVVVLQRPFEDITLSTSVLAQRVGVAFGPVTNPAGNRVALFGVKKGTTVSALRAAVQGLYVCNKGPHGLNAEKKVMDLVDQ